MKPTLEKAFGYQGDAMNLPVKDLAAAIPFYETVLGFRVLSRAETPHKSAVLGRDRVEIRLAENGGDPTQDGCAFHVTSVESLAAEFQSGGPAEGDLELRHRAARRRFLQGVLRRRARWTVLLVWRAAGELGVADLRLLENLAFVMKGGAVVKEQK